MRLIYDCVIVYTDYFSFLLFCVYLRTIFILIEETNQQPMDSNAQLTGRLYTQDDP